MTTNYDPIRGFDSNSSSGFTYIGSQEFGNEVESFLRESQSIRGGFYQQPSQPYRSMMIEKFDPRYPVIINREQGMGSFLSELEQANIPIAEVETPYHAKAFIDTNRDRGLVLTGNISTSAIELNDPTSKEETRIGLLERPLFAISNLLNLGYEGTKYQINTGFSLDRHRTRELHNILDQVQRSGSAESTNNFIVGGPGGNSSSIIASHIRRRAGQDISITAPYIDDREISSAIMEAIQGGSNVRIITTNPNAVSTYVRGTPLSEPNIERLRAAGATIYAPDKDQNLLIHNKAIGFSDGSGIIGSHNFTNKASSRQIEISIFYEDQGVADQYAADFERMISLTDELRPPDDKKHLVNIIRGQQNHVISREMAQVLDGGVVLPSNLGGSYFYARAMYNFTMRESGHHDFIVSNDDTSIATATYKLSYLLKNEEPPTHIPGAYLRYDKQLQTQGLGGWINEYIGIPSGWGRLYKDELGFIPSLLSTLGSALDNTYLFYTGGEDVLGLNTIYQPLTTRAAFYEDRSFTQEGLFSSVLGFGSSYAITTASAVALYLSLGEPLSLFMSEAIKENIEQSINNALPKSGIAEGTSWLNRLSTQGARQFTLGAGMSDYNSQELRRALLFSMYDWDGDSAVKSRIEYFSPDRFNISYYHLNSLMRRRGESLLQDIAKPFLMEVINPYTIQDEHNFGSKLDDLIHEIGKPIAINFNFGQGGDETVNDLFRLRETASKYHDNLNKRAQRDIDIYENTLKNKKASPRAIADAKKARDKALAWQQKNRSLNPIIAYMLDESLTNVVYEGVQGKVGGKTLSKYKEENQSNLAGLANRLNQTSVFLTNAGEERQMEIAKKLQSVLDEVPLNPANWRIFAKDNLKEYSVIKDYRVLGDILSFEDFTQTMRNLVLGQGGITSFIAKYEVASSGRTGIKGVGMSVVDRIHSIWSMVTESPFDAVRHLMDRRKLVNKLERSRDVYKSMEYSLAAQRELGWANNTTSAQFNALIQANLDDSTIKSQALTQARVTQTLTGGNLDVLHERETRRLARDRALNTLDPYKRSVTNSSGTFLVAMTEIDKELTQLGDETLDLVSAVNKSSREEAMGILSLTSERTFDRRVAKLKPGLGKDPTSKITKNKLMTYVFLGIAIASATESIFRSTSGVSMLSQIDLALAMGRNDDNATVNFSSGPLATFSGTGPRLLWSLATTGATAYVSYEIAGALRKVVAIDDVMDENTLMRTLKENPNLRVSHVGSTAMASTADEIAGLSKLDGTFRIHGTLADGRQVDTRLVKEVTEEAGRMVLKKSVSFLEGRSVATAAIAFTVISTAVMGAKSTVAWTLNEVRDQNKGLAPVILPVAGAGLGFGLSRMMKTNLGFAYGLAGFIAGGFTSAVLPSSILKNVLSLGRGSNEVDYNDMLVSAELTSFISQVRERSNQGKATKLELMAGIYAQTYSDFLGITASSSNRMTHVVAKQSPLPFIQFFYASTTENQVRDENTGAIISPGQTRFTTGIQTAPILGGSFSVGLPITITPGSGVAGISYADKSNMLDLINGAQNLVIGLTGAALITSGFKKAINSVLGKFGVEGYRHHYRNVEALHNIAEVTNTVARTLLAEVPARIVGAMTKADIELATKALAPTADLYSFTLAKYKSNEAFFRRNKNMMGKYFLGSLGGAYLGGSIGAIMGAESKEKMEQYVATGNLIGYTATPATQFILANFESPILRKLSDPLSTRTKNIGRVISKSPLRKIGGEFKAKSLSIATAFAIAYFLTDSKFGVSEEMDTHALTRVGIMGLYGAVVGSTYANLGNTFLGTEDTIRKWKRLENTKTALLDKTGKGRIGKTIDKVRHHYISLVQRGLEQDTNSIIKLVIQNETLLNNKALANTSSAMDQSLQLVTSIKESLPDLKAESKLTQAVLADLDGSNFDAAAKSLAYAKRQVVGRVDFGQAGKRFWRGAMPLAVATFAFSLFAGQLGGSDINEGLRSIYGDGGLLDWGSKQGGILHGLSNVTSGALKLITMTDVSDDLPEGYHSFLVDYVDRDGRPSIRRSANLFKSRNNPMTSVSELFSSAEKMFIMNSPNAFIQVVGPVGFTFRSGEYGKRINRYVQIQAPGADISTASYSIAASYGFRAALDGSLDSGFNIQNAMREINAGGRVDASILRRASIQILTSTAKMEPLKKRRRFSPIGNESLDFITVDPLLTASLNYRKQMMESMSHQPLASLGTKMIIDASTNHMLADVGLLNALFSRDPGALKAIMNDPFGLISRNVVIQQTTVFRPGERRNSLTSSRESTEMTAWMDQSDPIYSKDNQSNYLLSFLTNTFNNLLGSQGGLLKWGAVLGTGFVGLTSLAWAAGSISLSNETSSLIDKTNEFYSSNLYEPTIGRNKVEYLPIKADYSRSVGGQVIRQQGRRTINITKGNNVFEISQAFADDHSFLKNLNKALVQFQGQMNDVHLKFEGAGGFGEALQNKILDPHFLGSDSTELRKAAEAANLSPKEYLSKRLIEAYKEITETYINKFLTQLADTSIAISDGRKVSLLTLFAGDGVGADDLVRISGELFGGNLSPLEAMHELGGNRLVPYLMNNNYIKTQGTLVQGIVEDIVNETVRNGWADDTSMLTKGRLHIVNDSAFQGALRHLNDRISYALAFDEKSPLFTIKNYFGGVAKTSTVDRFRREMMRLWAVTRSDRGHDIDEELADLTREMGGVTTTRVSTVDNKVLTASQMNYAARHMGTNLVAAGDDVIIPIGVRKTARVKSSAVQQILKLSSNLDGTTSPSVIGVAKAKSIYGGASTVMAGASKLLEIGTFAFDIFESIDVFGAYSRLGASYTSGSYTDAQRMSLARETGGITATTLIAGAVGALMLNAGSIATAIGTGIMATAVGGVAGALGIGAGLLGGLALAAGAVLLGAAYLLMGSENRGRVNSFLGSGYRKLSEGIGSLLLGVGNVANNLGGGRAASTVLNAMGGILGGTVIGIGLVGMGLFSAAVLPVIGISAAVGMGMGIIGGLLLPNQMGALSRNLSSMMSKVPFLGQFFTQEGDWLRTTGKTIEGSPFFTGTAQQAIEYEFSKHMDLATSDSGTAMSQIITSREIYGGVSGDESYISNKSQGIVGRVTPGSQVDPTLQRELRARAILYSHTIVSRYIWNSVVSSSSNKRVIRDMENRYRGERLKEIESIEREARHTISGTHSRRGSNGDLIVSGTLLNNIVEINNMVREDSQRSRKALVIRVRENEVASSSLASQIQDYSIDRSSTSDIKNTISSASDKGVVIRAEVNQERSYIREAVSVNTTV